MALPMKEMMALSDEEFEERYNKVAKNTVEALNTYTYELQRRENEKTSKIMRKWTIAIGVMTAIMLGATIVNVLIALKDIG